MSQTCFQTVNKLLFFWTDSEILLPKERTIAETSETVTVFQAAFFLTPENHDIVALL